MKLHFDGDADRFRRVRALFPAARTLRQNPEWSTPNPKRFRWSRLQAMAERAIAKIRRAA